MKEDAAQQGPAPKKGGMSDFRKALIWTAVPLAGLGIIDFALGRFARFLWASGGPAAMFVVSLRFPLLLLWLAALFTAIAFAIAGKRRIAAGMFAGTGIGLVGVWLSCFGIPV